MSPSVDFGQPRHRSLEATAAWPCPKEKRDGPHLNGAGRGKSGRDVFVFVRENARWLVVWRTILRDVILGG